MRSTLAWFLPHSKSKLHVEDVQNGCLFYHTTIMDIEHKHQQLVSHTPKSFPSDSTHAMKRLQKWKKAPLTDDNGMKIWIFSNYDTHSICYYYYNN